MAEPTTTESTDGRPDDNLTDDRPIGDRPDAGPGTEASPDPATADDTAPAPTAPGPGLGPARVTAIIVGVLVAAMIALFAAGRDTDAVEGSGLLGTRAAPVNGEVLGGGDTFDIDDHRGSWVLVNFFATWCPPCVAEHPDLVELEAWGQENDLQLVSVVFNDPPDAVARFFEQRGGNWPVIDNPTVAVDYRVSQVPESFLISPAGQIIVHIEGQLAASEIIRTIEGA